MAINVFLCDPTEIDMFVFSQWLQGLNIENAVKGRSRKDFVGFEKSPNYLQLLQSETEDQYRIFNLLEPYLQNPRTLIKQHVFTIPSHVCKEITEQYYALDEAVIREFLGKKLNARHRRDLDDISKSTGVSLKSCCRQFDNIKQVLKAVDDLDGSLVSNIKSEFLLPDHLAKTYASVVFMSANKFETGKKRLAYMTVPDFMYCASLMIEYWTVGSDVASSRAVDDDLELDRDFLQELHDLKLYLTDRVWVDRRQRFILKDLKKKQHASGYISTVESNFKTIHKNVVSFGASLLHSRDLKDFFVDLHEKLIEYCMQIPWNKTQVEVFLTSFIDTFPECEAAHAKATGKPNLKEKPWKTVCIRYYITLKNCILQLYHN